MKLPVTGWWAASALGAGPAQTAANLMCGNAPGMRQTSGDIPGRDVFFGCIDAALPEIREHRWNMRSCRLLELAIREMQEKLDALVAKYGAERVGVVIGASNTGIDEAEAFVDQWLASGTKPDALDFSMIELGTPSAYLAMRLGVTGPAYTVSTACSSATKAFGSARRLIERGICDAVVTGGVDGRCRFAMNGFAALNALAQGRCRPLAADRDGINLGEAVALFTLERPGQSADFHLAGVGESSDAYHATAPDPEGCGAEMAMRAALADAGVSPSDVAYVNLHGTGTMANDAMELKAIGRVFGNFAVADPVLATDFDATWRTNAQTIVESTKGLTGHCLGAAGAIEAAVCLARLSMMGPGKTAISNSFAFGGSNACVVFQS